MKDTRLILAFTLVAMAVPWNSRRERVSGASKQQLENEKKGKCRQQEIHRLHERLEKLHTNHKEELLEARKKLTEKEDKIRQLKKTKGSILGWLLFLVYANDLQDYLWDGSMLALFADDSKLYGILDSASSSILLQQDLDGSSSGVWTGT